MVKIPEDGFGPIVTATAECLEETPVTVTVKEPVLFAVPSGVVTEMVPSVAPVGTVAVIEVALATVNEVALVPLKETSVAPVKLVPVIVTVVPAAPEPGVKEVMVGVKTSKEEELVPLLTGFETVIVPSVAPDGTFTPI